MRVGPFRGGVSYYPELPLTRFRDAPRVPAEDSMRAVVLPAILLASFLALANFWIAQRGGTVAAQKRDPVTITRMYTGPDGLTHFQETNLPIGEPMMKVAGIQFNRAPGPQKSGSIDEPTFAFHDAPHRRYVVTLSGRAEIEASGGGKFIADSGHILLAEDVTGKGHRYTTRPLGNEDWIHLFIEVDQPKPPAASR
jgi:hypothetical protein